MDIPGRLMMVFFQLFLYKKKKSIIYKRTCTELSLKLYLYIIFKYTLFYLYGDLVFT